MLSRLVVVAIVAMCTSRLYSQSPLSFESYGDRSNGGSGPLIAADFDHDGKVDLVQCCSPTQRLVFRAGKGDGTFQPPVTAFADALALQGGVASDVNHDGNLDLVTVASQNPPSPPASGTYVLSIFLGNGDGTFRVPEVYATTQGPGQAVVGNFFNDGYPDIAVGESYGLIELFRNSGDGTFVFAGSISVGTGNFSPVQVVAGSLNGTGISDLAALVLNSNDFAMPSELSVLWNNGSGSFNRQVLGQYSWPQITSAQINGDMNADILVSYQCALPAGSSYCVGFDGFYGQGENRLYKRTLVNSTSGLNPGDLGKIAGVDVDGDGYIDIAAIGALQCDSSTGECNDAPQGLSIWRGNADGSFLQTPENFFTSRNVQVGAAVMADFNRDGRMDFAQTQPGAGGPTEFYLNASRRESCGTYTISPSVTVCAPVDNTYSRGSVRVHAHSYDTAQVTALQEYVDGVLKFSEPVTSFDQRFPVGEGPHLFVTKGWDASGASFMSSRTITVYDGTPGATCYAAMNTARLCLPKGTSSSGPVLIVGNGNTGTSLTTSAQLYIDDNLVVNNEASCGVACYGLNTMVQTEQALSSGSHNLVFKVWDLAGNVYQDQKTIYVE
ncbi:FG-GAP repeat domain-containing protein [Terriglobus albidus]|uniref:FG-GAP repeat domain-containing protein n=1 Tax=Terriglobus albidus TaxID=1592106 RepID=UPI0021E0328B|nr:VCBS repeat-containing protein [Terriglobus albidus]